MFTFASAEGGASVGGYSASMEGVSLAASSIDDGFLAKKHSPRSPPKKTSKDGGGKESVFSKTLSAWKKNRGVNAGWCMLYKGVPGTFTISNAWMQSHVGNNNYKKDVTFF